MFETRTRDAVRTTYPKALSAVAFAAAIFAADLVAPAPAAAADYYAGKTITVIIGRPAGSGNDLAVRSFIKYWADYIPGKPTMVAKNMAGGGGRKAWNHGYDRVKPDGLTIVYSPYNPIPQILGQKSLKADFTKMPFIGAMQNPSLLYASTSVVKSRDEIMKMKGPIYGGQRPHLRFDLFGRMALDMLGADYKYSTGFKGSRKVFNAMRRGEVQMQTVGLNVYQRFAEPTLVKTGKATPLWYNPSRTLDGKYIDMANLFGGTPSFPDFYKKMKGKEPSGEIYEVYKWLLSSINGMSYVAFTTPGSPDAALKDLRAAYVKVTQNKDYLAEQKKMFGFNLPVIDVATGTHFTSLITKVPASHKTFLKNYIAKVSKKKS